MLTARAERIDLLHLGAREWEVERAEKVPEPSTEGCVLVWFGAVANSVPDVLVVADGTAGGFLAWTSTYLPHLAPITALVQVVEHRLIVSDEYGASHSGGRVDPRFERGCLGVLHGEVVAACHGTAPPPHVGLTPFVSTFSWLSLQRRRSRYIHVPLVTLRETWDEARRLLEAPRLGYLAEDVEEVWSLILEAEDGTGAIQHDEEREVVAFLRSIRDGNVSPDIFAAVRGHSGVFDLLNSGPLEGRVDALRGFVHDLYDRRNVPASHAVLAGFAVSLVSQGTFDHVRLLSPGRVSDARALLWYGWFEFYRYLPEPASPAASSASLQLSRELTMPSSPLRRRDISFDELRVLSRQKRPFGECLLDLRHPLRVEIAADAVALIQPGVARTRGGRPHPIQRSLFDD